ncbi:MAG: T9SS type A sorting domain-containing protein [Bacteroidales bacterium]|jgi:hypothetical protein|nr:T9SS type A sorting domain-containing protein [Bacteroidales bacterium]
MKRFILCSVILLLLSNCSISFANNNWPDYFSLEATPSKSESKAQPTVVITPITYDVCPNVGTVTVNAVITNGTAPFSISWLGATVDPTDNEYATITINPNLCNTTITVYVSVTDNDGLTANANMSFTVKDDQPPVITNTLPAYTGTGCDISVYPANNSLTFLTASGLTISDNCSNNSDLIVTSNDVITGNCPLRITRTYTIKDACGNSATTTQNITINKPVFTISIPNGTTTVNCINNTFTPDALAPTVYDACGTLLTPVLTNIVTNPSMFTCDGTRVYEYTYTDCEGNTAIWTYTFNIEPTFTITATPGEIVVNCPADVYQPDAFLPTVANSCGNIVTNIVLTSIVPSNPSTITCNGEVIYTYTFTDCAGNTDTWDFTFIIDMPPFTISDAPGTANVACVSDIIEPSTISPSVLPVATDYCGNIITNIILHSTVSYPSIDCEQTRVYTYRYTDCLGRYADWTYTYTINRAPFSITQPAGALTVNCVAEIFEPTTFLPVVFDACNKRITNIVLTSTVDAPTSPLTCEGTRTYTYTYTDCSGNTDTWDFVFTVQLPALVINTPNGSTTVNCVSKIDETSIILPQVYGACNTLIPGVKTNDVLTEPIPNCNGTRVLEYTFTDCASNSVVWTYTFNIVPEIIFSAANEEHTVNCIADIVAPTVIPSAVDGCGNVINPTGPTITETPNPLTCEGTRVYSYEYIDCAGNSVYWTSTFHVEIPAFTIADPPGTQTVTCISDIIAPTAYIPTVVDVCGNTLTAQLISADETPNPLTCNGTKVYRYRYTDCAGNTADWTYTYTVDMPGFTIGVPGGTATVDCVDDIVVPTAYLPVVTDYCGNNITNIVLSNISNNPDPITCNGTREYTYTFTDCAGNTDTWTYEYTVTRPAFSITVPDGNVTVACPSAAVEPTAFLPSIYDECNNLITDIQLINTPTSVTCEGNMDYIYEYTDCAGNTDTWTFTYNVVAPAFNPTLTPGTETIGCISGFYQPDSHAPVVTDNCGRNVPAVYVNYTDTPNPITCEGTRTYNYTYTDCAGNIAYWTYTFTVVIPTLNITTAPGAATVSCPNLAVDPSALVPTISDACGNVLTNYTITNIIDLPNPLTCEGTREYVFTFTDCAGNTDDWSFIYTIEAQPLTIYPTSSTEVVNCISDIPDANYVSNNLPTFTDYCGNVLTNYTFLGSTDNPNPLTCSGTRIFRFEFTDCAGNTAEWSKVYFVSVLPNNDPIPAGQTTVNCIADIDENSITFPDAYDNCGNLITNIQFVNTVENPNPLVCSGGTKTYNYRYYDCGGNSRNWSFTFNIVSSPFTITVPPGFTNVNCPNDMFDPIGYIPVINDECGDVITDIQEISVVYTPNPIICEGTRVHTYRYTDCSGNYADWTYTINVNRPEFTITTPAKDTTVNCVADIEHIVNNNLISLPIITDACGDVISNIHITNVVNTPSVIPCTGGKRVYTFTYYDCSGNSADWLYTFYVNLPQLEIPDDDKIIHVDCPSLIIEPTQFLPVVYDLCGNLITDIVLLDYTESPNPLECIGTATYRYMYTDCAGNSDIWTCTYIVQMPAFTITELPGETTVDCPSDIYEPWNLIPEVTDYCGNIITNIQIVNITNTPTTITCDGTSVYTFRYTDCVGQTADWQFTFNVERPVFVIEAAPGSTTVNCLSEIFNPITQLPQVYDPCGNLITNPILTDIRETPNPVMCAGTRTYVYTYTEPCFGQTAEWTYTFNVTPSQFTMPETHKDVVVVCPSNAVEPTALLPVVYDVCGRRIYDIQLLGYVDSPNPLVCNGTRTYTYQYKDCGGNTALWTCTYHIGDIPMFSIDIPPFDTTVNCVADLFVPTYDMLPEIYDFCGNLLTMPFISDIIYDPPNLICAGSRTLVYTYTDCSGHTANWSYIIHVSPPQFAITSPPGSTTVTCVSEIVPPPASVLPIVYDACGNLITDIQLTDHIDQPDPLVCNGYRTYIYTYTDCAGNTADWMYTYFVNDLPPLNLTLVDQDTTVNCFNDIFQPDEFLPEAFDACGNLITNIQLNGYTDNPNPITCEGSRTYHYTYYDCSNNSATWNFTFNINIPQFTIEEAPIDSTIYCIADLFDPIAFIPEVYDYCGSLITNIVSNTIDTPPTFSCEGTRVITYTYTDCAGNTANWTYTINIDMPQFVINELPGDTTVNCYNDIFEPLQFTPIVTDYCGNTITNVVLTDISENPEQFECNGSRTYTYTYTDCAGNTADWKFTFFVVTPIFYINDAPGDVTVSCLSDAVEPTAFLPVVQDFCGNTITNIVLVNKEENPDPVTCEGTIIYHYLYTDCYGNTATWHYKYTIVTTPFTINEPDGQLTVNCPSQVITPINYLPEVYDNCGNLITNITLTDSGTTPPAGITCEGSKYYTYTYTDCAGYTDTWTFTYNVIRPTFVVNAEPGVAYVNCPTEIYEPTNLVPVVYDICGNLLDPPILTDITNNPSTITCAGTRVYTYTYIDCKGDFADWTYTYHVMPELVISTPPMVENVNCISGTYEPTAHLPVVVNSCGYTLPAPSLISIVDNPLNITCTGTRTYTYLYTDCANNTATWTYTFNIQVPELVISQPPIVNTVSCVSEMFDPSSIIPQISDACGNPISNVMLLRIDNVPNEITCTGTRTYTYRYTDCVGHIADWTYTFIVDMPTFTITQPAGSTTVNCLSDITAPVFPVVRDACNNIITNIQLTDVQDNPSPLDCAGSRTHVYTYTDCAGNTANWEYTYNIQGLPLVMTTQPMTVVINCIDDLVEPTAHIPTILDGCGNATTHALTNEQSNPTTITCEGTKVYTYTFTDCLGNTADWTFTYVLIVEPFTINAENVLQTVACVSEALVEPHTVPGNLPTILDNCGNDISGSFHLNVSNEITGCQGYVTYNYVFYDCADNQAIWQYKYHVVPEPLSITVQNVEQVVECPGMALVLPHTVQGLMPTVLDNCGNDISNTYFLSNTINQLGCEGSVEYIYTYSDCAGYTDNWSYKYIVDMPQFTITEPNGSETVNCISETYQPDDLKPVVYDYCGNLITSINFNGYTDQPTPIACEGTRTYKYTYTDCAGNSAVWEYAFNIVKPTELILDIEPGIAYVNCLADVTQPTASMLPVAHDICGTPLATPAYVNFYDDPYPLVCSGTRTYYYTYTDCAGNTAEWQYIYYVGPMYPPQVPGDVHTTVTNIADAIAPGLPTIHDMCGNIVHPTLVVQNDPDPLECQGTRTYIYTYTDCAGNSSDWTYSYTIIPNNLYMQTLSWTHGCTTGDGGSITLRAWGGSAPYTFYWKKTTGQVSSSQPTYNNVYTFTDLSAGTYEVYITDVNNCKQTVFNTITIEIRPGYVTYDFMQLCESELPIKYGDSTIYTPGLHDIIFNTQQECDSLVHLTVSTYPEYLISTQDTLCSYDLPYTWRGQTINGPGIYYDYLETVINRCDSIYEFEVTIVNELDEIGSISGTTEFIFGSDIFYGMYIYNIDPVEGATHYEWQILDAPWHIEHNYGTVCTLYVRSRDVARLTVQAFNKCGGSQISTLTMIAHAGIDDIDGSSISIYPNPANDYMEIKFEKYEGKTEISVYDSSGKLVDVMALNITSETERIRRSTTLYKNGIYFIHIKNNKTSITERIIIQH